MNLFHYFAPISSIILCAVRKPLCGEAAVSPVEKNCPETESIIQMRKNQRIVKKLTEAVGMHAEP